jgi:hypothetical protein
MHRGSKVFGILEYWNISIWCHNPKRQNLKFHYCVTGVCH